MSNVGAAVMNNEADENGYEANNEENGYEEGGGFFMFSDEDEKAFVTGEKDFYNAFEEALADTYDCRSYLLRLTSYFWEQFIHSFEHLCYLFKGLSLNASKH